MTAGSLATFSIGLEYARSYVRKSDLHVRDLAAPSLPFVRSNTVRGRQVGTLRF